VRKTISVLLLAAALLLAGCANMLPARPGSDARIHRWIEQQRYGAALQARERRTTNDPTKENRTWLAHVKTLAADYDAKLAATALTQQTRGQWKEAFATVDQALQNYPKGPKLLKARTVLRQKQSKRLDQLETDLLFAKGEWLKRSAPLYQELAKTDPDDLETAWKAEQLEKQKRDSAARLLHLGNKALDHRRYKLAHRALELADQLHSNRESKQALGQLHHVLDQQAEKKRVRARQAQTRQRNEQTRRLMTEVHQAIMNADLNRARDKLAELTALEGNDPQLDELAKALDQAIAAKVTELTAQGNTLYTRGKIRDAKRTWESALELDPGNQHLRSRIERAERVLNKLQKLQQQKNHQ
jgi:tetratricopeptide (TPR) repeat protein